METLSWFAVGAGLFIFWIFIGVISTAPDGKISSLTDRLTVFFVLAGFFWLLINLVLPIFQGWLLPTEWVTYSSIFWWISFIGGVLGLFVVSKFRKSKNSKV